MHHQLLPTGPPKCLINSDETVQEGDHRRLRGIEAKDSMATNLHMINLWKGREIKNITEGKHN